jgi:hypothetical protein
MVARLTPDQKVACSIHVGFNTPDPSPEFFFFSFGLCRKHFVVYGYGLMRAALVGLLFYRGSSIFLARMFRILKFIGTPLFFGSQVGFYFLFTKTKKKASCSGTTTPPKDKEKTPKHS